MMRRIRKIADEFWNELDDDWTSDDDEEEEEETA